MGIERKKGAPIRASGGIEKSPVIETQPSGNTNVRQGDTPDAKGRKSNAMDGVPSRRRYLRTVLAYCPFTRLNDRLPDTA
jgi:hypothetical protein